MQSLTIAEAAQKLPDLIDAALRGEEVVITKDDLSVVKIVPANLAQPSLSLEVLKD
jgi:prevent-host-death family protein